MRQFTACKGFNNAMKFIHKLLQNRHNAELLSPIPSARTFTSSGKTKRVVYVSSSKNIFENLSLEEWLHENEDVTDTECLLMWRNGPAVVIGRHQNPWMECDVCKAKEREISVVRRSSGGGTVYHDEGNLNLSFLMHRSRYDRRRNLSLVIAALTSQWNLDLDLNCRDDLVLDGVYKVSGTASKLSGSRTYHHFTLVFDMDRDVMSSVLHSPLVGVNCKATRSVPSLVKNLTEDAPDMTFDSLVRIIGQRFLEDRKDEDFRIVSPADEDRFPGVRAIQRRLQSWEWVFGKTPSFTISRTFTKPVQDKTASFSEYSLRAQVVIGKGRMHSVSAKLSVKPREGGQSMDLPFQLEDMVDVVGKRLEERELRDLWKRWRGRAREEEGRDGLLCWGVECLMKCVPVGYGDS